MENFFQWFKQQPNYYQKPWLILGKGPSYSTLSNYDTNSFFKISLNHVIRDEVVEIAHIIDFDVALDCAAQIASNARVLVMPWMPHIQNKPGPKNVEELVEEHPILSTLAMQGRVKFYHLKSSKLRKDDSPVIPTNFFSSEAVVNLLSMSGVKKIRTIGVDGGNSYSEKFKDLTDKTLLNNGHANFDIQFQSISKKIMMENLDYAPLGVSVPVKIYVGSANEQMLSVRVLEYSIKKRSSLPVEVIPLFKNSITYPLPQKKENQPRTPFSFQRFLIPQLNDFKGRAIYVDSDMQVFTDIKDLWTKDMTDADLLAAHGADGSTRRPQFSVMLLDCEKLKWDVKDIVKLLDDDTLDYEKLMYEMRVAKNINLTIEREWNSLEYFKKGETKLVHYTDMGTQPWLFKTNSLTALWVEELTTAVNEGFIPLSEFKSYILSGHVRPSLWYQVKKKQFDPKQIPSLYNAFDKYFVPPHLVKKSSAGSLRKNKLMARILTAFI